jgi:hypothetical protein
MFDIMKRWKLRITPFVWEDYYYGQLYPLGHRSKELLVNYLIDEERAAMLNAADPIWCKQADGAGYDLATRRVYKAGDRSAQFKSEQEIINALEDFIEREGMIDTSKIIFYDEKTKQERVVWVRLQE